CQLSQIEVERVEVVSNRVKRVLRCDTLNRLEETPTVNGWDAAEALHPFRCRGFVVIRPWPVAWRASAGLVWRAVTNVKHPGKFVVPKHAGPLRRLAEYNARVRHRRVRVRLFALDVQLREPRFRRSRGDAIAKFARQEFYSVVEFSFRRARGLGYSVERAALVNLAKARQQHASNRRLDLRLIGARRDKRGGDGEIGETRRLLRCNYLQ